MTAERRLRALTAKDVETVREWRNRTLIAMRTPFLLTEEMQAEFYKTVVSHRQASHRYWGVELVLPRAEVLVACVGLTYIQWENGIAEISLIVDPSKPRLGHGRAAVDLVLAEAFEQLRLDTVCGEVYRCNPAIDFWMKVTERYGAVGVQLPRRKFWNGQLWDSLYFSIALDAYIEATRSTSQNHGQNTNESDDLSPA